MNASLKARDLVRLAGALLISALALGGLCSTAHANWASNGVPVATGPDSQILPAVCSDGAGGVIVVWRAYLFGSPEQLYAQRLDASGQPLWGAGGVRVAPSTREQHVPALLPMSDGGVMIAWEENRQSDFDIFVQRLTASGAIALGWPATGLQLSFHTSSEMDPSIVSDGSDGAFVAWDLVYADTDWDIYAGHVLGNGTKDPAWPGAGLPVCTSTSWEDYPVALSDRAGGVFIAWRDSNLATQETDVYATRLLSSGVNAAGWTPGGNAICAAAGRQGVPNLVADATDGFLAAWRDFRYEAAGDIFATRVHGDATEAWAHFGVPMCVWSGAQGNNWRVAMASDGAGGAFLAWPDERALGASGGDIYAQRVDGSGCALWDMAGLEVCGAPGLQSELTLCSDAAGGALAVWTDRRAGMDVYAQHVGWDGAFAWPHDGLALVTATGTQNFPAVAPDGLGGLVAAWQDARDGTSDIYAGQLTGTSNLVVTAVLPGWDAPAVPRNQPGAGLGSAHVTPELNGNLVGTWLSYQALITEPNPVPAFDVDCRIDEGVGSTAVFADGTPPAWWAGLDTGPFPVGGGRHTVSLEADPDHRVVELEEDDNRWLGQWVWSPLFLVPANPVERPLPPEWGYLGLPNTDGMAYPRCDMNAAWVTSIAPRQADTDCDLYLFDDYAGSTSGFSHFLAGSAYALTSTDFVVGHFLSAPAIVYPGVCRYGEAGSGTYFVDATEATAHQGPGPPMHWQAVTLPAGRLADVYELFLTAGTTYHVAVVREQGVSTLAVDLFSAVPGGVYGRGQAVAQSGEISPVLSQLTYSAPVNGWYPVVVYRTTGDDAGTAARYGLLWDTRPIVDVPGGPSGSPTLWLAGARPNPVRDQAALAFSLSRRGPASLEVFDARGRLLRRLAQETMDAGEHRLTWDGRTEAGAPAPSGIAWLRLVAEGRTLVQKVALVR